MTSPTLAFIGGGNMAGAIFGGLVRSGWPAAQIIVVEPSAEQRERIAATCPAVRLLAQADASLAGASVMVWAVKPQTFAEAATPCAAWVGGALQLSVMAGIRSETLVHATGSERVVRAMPNTPALIGQGIAGLFARDAVSAADRDVVEQVLAPTGQLLWVAHEADLDAVTALSGSGPAYVFYFIEAMIEAGVQMGLSAEQARQLAQQTFVGAGALAQHSGEPVALLRARVTSKGGTTQAAIESLEASQVRVAIVQAARAAQARAVELGRS